MSRKHQRSVLRLDQPDLSRSKAHRLTLFLLVSSADYFCKNSLDPDQARQFDTLIVFLKELFEKVGFGKKISRQQKAGSFSRGPRVNNQILPCIGK